MNMPENNIDKPFNEKLIELLKTDSCFVDDEGELIKAAVIDRAWKIDRNLVKLLLSKPEIEKKFFDEIEGHWIFNINTFIEYISDKNFLANSYTRLRNKIGLNIDGKFLLERGEVSLVWPYKDCVLEGGQTKEEEKRKEIFFNEILAQDEIDRLFDPKVLTNFKRYTPDGEQKVTEIKRGENDTIKENLIIKGNNLLALHTLKTQFRGKVKLIYIDPPYNTGNDSFGYNDNFNHSSWLTFMKNRLEAAKELLIDDGLIFIQCDDNEQAYLKVMLDEIFYRENFISTLIWEARSGQGNTVSNIAETHEYILVYARKKECIELKRQERLSNGGNYSDEIGKYRREQLRQWGQVDRREDRPSMYFPIKSPEGVLIYPKRNDGTDGRWRFGVKRIEKLLKNNDIDFVKDEKNEWHCYRKIRDGKISSYAYTTFLNKIGTASTATLELKSLFGKKIFGTPKPEKLLQHIIHIGSDEGDIIFDFFAGSGTTVSVAHKMKRQWITVEQMDYLEKITLQRLKKVIGKKVKKENKAIEKLEYDTGGISKSVNWQGGGDFIYCELVKYNEAFMDKIQSAETSDDLLKIWKDIAKNSFLNWYVNPEMPEEAVNNFTEIGRFENGLEKQKKLLAELLNKNQLYVNLSEIDDEDFKVSEDDKKLNQSFYGEAYNG
jgi:adenine-specific DNA-methyltransferase